MLLPARLPQIPQRTPIPPTKLDDYGFALQEQVLQTQPIGGAGASYTPPLSLVQVDTENVKVTFGQVNGITPTNVNTNIDVSSNDRPWNIYIHIEIDAAGIVTSAEIVGSDSAMPSDDIYDAYRLVGIAAVTDAVITEILTSSAWSQTFVPCGRNTSDPETTPGTYYWVVA